MIDTKVKPQIWVGDGGRMACFHCAGATLEAGIRTQPRAKILPSINGERYHLLDKTTLAEMGAIFAESELPVECECRRVRWDSAAQTLTSHATTAGLG